MKSKTLFCQSCGMPLEKEIDFDKNFDTSKNQEYCYFCYRNGHFSDAFVTMEQIIE